MADSLRDERYRYTVWIHRKTGEEVARAFFDYHADPFETMNLASDPAYRRELDRLTTQLNAKMQK